MRVGLVVPCYIDVFYPEVGIAALELLEKLGVEVAYPFDQTCCGQPMANSGCESDARATEELFIRNFSGFEYVVIPSGSCTHHVRNKFIAAPLSMERENVRSHARGRKSEIIQQTSSRTRQHRRPSFPSGQGAALRRDRIRFFAAPGHSAEAVLQRTCDLRYRHSIRTISRCSHVHHEAAPSDVEMHDMIRQHTERALPSQTARRLPKLHAIFELFHRRRLDESIRSSATHKPLRVTYQENPTIPD